MNTTQMNKQLLIASVIAFFMLLTRGSHVLTSVALPDASLALLLMGGLVLRKSCWLIVFALLATIIDFGASQMNSWYGFCLTPAYWGMLPSYAAMWLAGVWLAHQSDSLHVAKYSTASLLATFTAFVISTQTYYLFSGRFPNNGMMQTMTYGWNYLPSYMGYTAMYLLAFWLIAKALPSLNLAHSTRSKTA